MKFSLLSFNTLGTPFFAPNITLRYQAIAQTIAQQNLDIVCFQEVVTYYHVFQLKKYLKMYPHFVYKKSLFGPKGGLLIASKVPIASWSFKPFTSFGSFKNKSFYSNLLQNGMLICTLKDLPLVLLNTHTVSDFEFEWSPTNHLYRYVKSQVEQIIKEITAQTSEGKRIIAMGDFNMKKNSRLYKYLLDQTKASDVFKKDSFPTYHSERLNYKFNGKTSERIDFVLLTGLKTSSVVSQSYVFDKQVRLANKKTSYLSDHIGLKVDFDIV